MSENLDRLKTVRGLYRGVVTKLTRETDTLLATEPLTAEQTDRLSVIKQQLMSKEQMLEVLNRNILTCVRWRKLILR